MNRLDLIEGIPTLDKELLEFMHSDELKRLAAMTHECNCVMPN